MIGNADRYVDGTYFESNPTWHLEDAPFKARQIAKILNRNQIQFSSAIEIGCGVGGVLGNLKEMYPHAFLKGYDVSPDAIARARQLYPTLEFEVCGESMRDIPKSDVLLAIDVFEHVPNCLEFCSQCKDRAEYKIYHIPLDIHCLAVLRGTIVNARKQVGHLHAFTEETALATLEETGHRIIDWGYSPGGLEGGKKRSWQWKVANVPRRIISLVSTKVAQRLLGGWSLAVLAE